MLVPKRERHPFVNRDQPCANGCQPVHAMSTATSMYSTSKAPHFGLHSAPLTIRYYGTVAYTN